ncbi:iron-sulfur cluster assembly protein [Anderseniella sp. Alg231-50]|uniref:iron-sulfur cluster assembly protein n=1 Tax=Anderseniella sp. Alg231-50 TaxID=1922226 RepID=UPI00307C99B6
MSKQQETRVFEVDLEDPKVRTVWAQIEKVCDPELDEPVTDMHFIERVEIDGDDHVTVSFRLPTYWCSANFAFLMANDIRVQVEQLDWVSHASVQLEDHMFSEQVNTGVNTGLSFQKTFADLAPDQGLDEIREKFREKAFQRRQEILLLALRKIGWSDSRITAMTLEQLAAFRFDEDEAAKQKPRYLALAGELGYAPAPDDRVFTDYGGSPLAAAGLDDHLKDLRSVRINMEFNGALCRGLLNARYKELEPHDGEPTLLDFILDKVPPAASGGQNNNTRQTTSD